MVKCNSSKEVAIVACIQHVRQGQKLVFHERDQRRHDERGLAQQHGRVLVAKTLAVPRGHEAAHVAAAVEQLADDLPLQPAASAGSCSPTA